MFSFICLTIFIIASMFFALYLFLTYFRPTKCWVERVFLLYKIMPKRFSNIFDVNIREIEMLLNFLIEHRCSDENSVVREIRNGYVLKYYPEGYMENKRVWPFAYVEIYDANVRATLRVGFDANSVPKYQIEHRQSKESTAKMFFRSRQGSPNELERYMKDKNGRIEVMENYRDYTIRNII